MNGFLVMVALAAAAATTAQAHNPLAMLRDPVGYLKQFDQQTESSSARRQANQCCARTCQLNGAQGCVVNTTYCGGAQCYDVSTCNATVGAGGACQARPDLGQACGGPPGPFPVQDDCLFRQTGPAGNLRCVTPTGAASRTCQVARYVQPGGACTDTYQCYSGECDNGACTAAVAPGNPCSFGSICTADHYCDVVQGTCRPQVAVGGACQFGSECLGNQNGLASCSNSVCVATASVPNGQFASENFVCQSFFRDYRTNTCQPAPAGLPPATQCTTSNDCNATNSEQCLCDESTGTSLCRNGEEMGYLGSAAYSRCPAEIAAYLTCAQAQTGFWLSYGPDARCVAEVDAAFCCLQANLGDYFDGNVCVDFAANGCPASPSGNPSGTPSGSGSGSGTPSGSPSGVPAGNTSGVTVIDNGASASNAAATAVVVGALALAAQDRN